MWQRSVLYECFLILSAINQVQAVTMMHQCLYKCISDMSALFVAVVTAVNSSLLRLVFYRLWDQ